MSNKPKYTLWLTDRQNKRRRTRAGVAFETPFGFTIVLAPGITLRETEQDRYYLNLYEDQPQRDPKNFSDVPFGGNDKADDDEPHRS